MPRMSKTRKQEWALFLNERNRITYNELCRRCMNNCKQSFTYHDNDLNNDTYFCWTSYPDCYAVG